MRQSVESKNPSDSTLLQHEDPTQSGRQRMEDIGGNQWLVEALQPAPYRFSDGVVLILAEKRPCAAGSTSRCFILISELLPQPAG